MKEQEKEEKVKEEYIKYKIIEEQIGNAIYQREMIKQSIEEINKSIEAIEKISELKKNDEAWFSLGGDVFLRGNVLERNKLLINIGNGIIQEKNIEEAKTFLNKRLNEMKDVLEKIERNIEMQAKMMNETERRIQSLLKDEKHSTKE